MTDNFMSCVHRRDEQTQIERHENALLRQENDKLRAENMTIREAMRNPICANCGGAAVLGEVSLEEQHLRIENARLKDELDRVCALAGKFLGRPISSGSSMSALQGCSGLELGVGTNGGFWLGPLGASALQPLPDLMGAGGLPAPWVRRRPCACPWASAPSTARCTARPTASTAPSSSSWGSPQWRSS